MLGSDTLCKDVPGVACSWRKTREFTKGRLSEFPSQVLSEAIEKYPAAFKDTMAFLDTDADS